MASGSALKMERSVTDGPPQETATKPPPMLFGVFAVPNFLFADTADADMEQLENRPVSLTPVKRGQDPRVSTRTFPSEWLQQKHHAPTPPSNRQPLSTITNNASAVQNDHSPLRQKDKQQEQALIASPSPSQSTPSRSRIRASARARPPTLNPTPTKVREFLLSRKLRPSAPSAQGSPAGAPPPPQQSTDVIGTADEEVTSTVANLDSSFSSIPCSAAAGGIDIAIPLSDDDFSEDDFNSCEADEADFVDVKQLATESAPLLPPTPAEPMPAMPKEAAGDTQDAASEPGAGLDDRMSQVQGQHLTAHGVIESYDQQVLDQQEEAVSKRKHRTVVEGQCDDKPSTNKVVNRSVALAAMKADVIMLRLYAEEQMRREADEPDMQLPPLLGLESPGVDTAGLTLQDDECEAARIRRENGRKAQQLAQMKAELARIENSQKEPQALLPSDPTPAVKSKKKLISEAEVETLRKTNEEREQQLLAMKRELHELLTRAGT
eukprot:SAG31_NODE_654_length_13128_cov_10.472408_2_plen_493_part_00